MIHTPKSTRIPRAGYTPMTEADREAFQSYQKLYRQAVEERRSARLEDRPADYAGALHIEGRMDETRLRSLAACLNREAGSLYADILEEADSEPLAAYKAQLLTIVGGWIGSKAIELGAGNIPLHTMHAEGLNAQAGSDNDVRQWQLTPEPVDLDRVILNHQLAGKKFGRLLVLACIGSTGGPAPLLCFCECGHFTVTTAANLKAGVRSCGCLKAEKARETGSRITHGGKGTRLYHIWCDMKHRCAARSGRLFDYYGARGIHVCREWNDSFEAFRAWSLANGYAEGLSIDRIDNSGPYSPHNCRWSTQAQQNRNYSRNIVVEYEGKHMLLTDAAELSGIPYGALRYRYHHGGKDNPTRLFAPLQVAEKANNGDTGRTPVLK